MQPHYRQVHIGQRAHVSIWMRCPVFQLASIPYSYGVL